MNVESGRAARGRRKAVDEVLNLVPYIDLLTCMISFLLITAVWTQVAQLQAKARGAPGETDEPPSPRRKIVIVVGDEGFNVVVDAETHPVAKVSGGLDFTALGAMLTRIKRETPEHEDALIAADDGIRFDTLIATMDVALTAGFFSVSLGESNVANL